MINFALPGLYEHFDVNRILIMLQKKYPECFYEDIKITAFYGNFQFCIWDSGRTFTSYKCTPIEQIKEIQSFYNVENKIPMRFIYTNNQISTKEQLQDKYCNIITSICQNELNEIVVNSNILEEYLRENYPQYKYISSTTKCLSNKEKAMGELNCNYFKVCLDYNLNHNIDFLKNLSDDQKDKVELLINPVCGAGCPTRKEHYKLNSLFSLNYGKTYHLPICYAKKAALYPYDLKIRNEISIDDILTTYKDINITNFKIEGRTFSTLAYIEYILKYLVKVKYQLFILQMFHIELNKINNNIKLI